MCQGSTIPSKPAESKNLWITECINPVNTERNIYTYCDNTFENAFLLKHNCNVDACRLCCATHDQSFKNTSSSGNLLAHALKQSSTVLTLLDVFLND